MCDFKKKKKNYYNNFIFCTKNKAKLYKYMIRRFNNKKMIEIIIIN